MVKHKKTYALLLDVSSMKHTMVIVSVNVSLTYSLARMVRIVCPLQSDERYANASYREGLLASAPRPITSR